MIKNGTKPMLKAPKRNFHQYFGGTLSVPDFNLDAGLWMPDQDDDLAYTECTGYTVCDIKTDFDKKLYSPDWQYAKTLQLEGQPAGTNGADFHVAMQSAVVFGAVEQKNAKINAKSFGELYVAAINNWDASLNAGAVQNAEIGTYNALGLGDAFDSIKSTAYTNKMGVSIGSPWYPEWENKGLGNGMMIAGDGRVSMPANPQNTAGLPWHNWVIKGKITIMGVEYLIGKSWQGAKYGAGGFHYISREVINAVMAVPGSGAVAFADSGNRWLNLCIIFFTQEPSLLPYLPQILAAEMKVNIPSNKITHK